MSSEITCGDIPDMWIEGRDQDRKDVGRKEGKWCREMSSFSPVRQNADMVRDAVRTLFSLTEKLALCRPAHKLTQTWFRIEEISILIKCQLVILMKFK